MKNHLIKTAHGPNHWIFPWNHLAPIKANILGWRLEMNRLPTTDLLLQRKIAIPSTTCLLCNASVESIQHIFLECPFADILWSLMLSWCKIPLRRPLQAKDLFELHMDPFIPPNKAKHINLIVLSYCWTIWKIRNERVFSNKEPSIRFAMKEIKTTSYLWLANRTNSSELDWTKCFVSCSFGRPENNTDDCCLVGQERLPLGLRLGLSFYLLIYESVSSGIQSSGNLKMSGHHRQDRRFTAGGNEHDGRDPRDVEIERLRQRVCELEINSFDKYERQYEDTPTDSAVEEYENEGGVIQKFFSPVMEEYENEGGGFEILFHQRHPSQPTPLQRHRRPSPATPQQRRHSTPPAPPQTDLIRSLGIRTEIPEFEGRLCPDDFLDWLRTMDRIFDLRDTPDHIKVKLVAIRLKKSASLWWDHVQNQRYREGKHRVKSWDKMKRLMEKKFLPVTHKQDSYVEFHTLKQQTLTVEEFIVEFERVRMHCGVEENEEQTIACFLGCLRTDISDVVYLQQYYSFHDVCRLALKVEKQLSAKQKTTRFGSFSRALQSATVPVRVGPMKAEPPALTGVSPTPATSSLRCFKCQGIGHLKRDCPNKQVLTLIEEADPLYDTEDEVETEVVYLDRGELLVTRRLLNTVVLDQDDDTTTLTPERCSTRSRVAIKNRLCGACKGVPTIGCLWADNDRRKPRHRSYPVVDGSVAQQGEDDTDQRGSPHSPTQAGPTESG
ncbi:reverse transcriptase domain-containing protein [Artemisia annua]|uniref:Reverse transcriptase domain-containing protein n=1 Tax=Artemisia annua TaxID=35608 RepID=A0A2U1KT82_ARTAN|nr:reverse transcriptase domain-containing protein [Artemisia annua]